MSFSKRSRRSQGLHAPVEELPLSVALQIAPLKLHVQNRWHGKHLHSPAQNFPSLPLASTAVLRWRQCHKNQLYHLTAVFGQPFPSLLFFIWMCPGALTLQEQLKIKALAGRKLLFVWGSFLEGSSPIWPIARPSQGRWQEYNTSHIQMCRQKFWNSTQCFWEDNSISLRSAEYQLLYQIQCEIATKLQILLI